MIHYTLLPEEEIRKLRKEYRIRFIIILFFFISCAIIIGILSLFPSYILSRNQGSQAEKSREELQKSREERGIAQVEKELDQSKKIINEIDAELPKAVFSDLVTSIASHRTSSILISDFELKSTQAKGTTTVEIVIQGKALTRDALLSFKKSLDQDKRFSSAELPISDLARSKDIPFAIRLIFMN